MLATLASLGCACEPHWTALTTSLDRVVLSVGSDDSDVWLVGGGQGNGTPTLVKRLHAGAWSSPAVDGDETLWWFGGRFTVGERGLAYRVGDALERVPTPTSATLFGVWSASESEAWAVGGTPVGNGENDVILRWDGAQWTKVPAPQPKGLAYFKVWGRARDDVYIVGQGGTALHYDGSAWSAVQTPTRATLLTVTGNATETWAVGGPPAVLVKWDGAQWAEQQLPFDASGLTGVSLSAAGDLYVVGLAGVRWRRIGGKWVDDSDQPVLGDLHAVWAAPGADAWAVGGNYIATDPGTPRKGIVAHLGSGVPPL